MKNRQFRSLVWDSLMFTPVIFSIQGYYRRAEACKMQGLALQSRGQSRHATTVFQRAVQDYVECYKRSKPKDVDLLCQAIELAVDHSKFISQSFVQGTENVTIQQPFLQCLCLNHLSILQMERGFSIANLRSEKFLSTF